MQSYDIQIQDLINTVRDHPNVHLDKREENRGEDFIDILIDTDKEQEEATIICAQTDEGRIDFLIMTSSGAAEHEVVDRGFAVFLSLDESIEQDLLAHA